MNAALVCQVNNKSLCNNITPIPTYHEYIRGHRRLEKNVEEEKASAIQLFSYFVLSWNPSATDFHLFYHRRHQHHHTSLSLSWIRRWDVFPYGECVFHYEIYNGSLNWLSLNNILDCYGMGFHTSIQNTLYEP